MCNDGFGWVLNIALCFACFTKRGNFKSPLCEQIDKVVFTHQMQTSNHNGVAT